MKIGDMVKVVDCEETYSSFTGMAERMGLSGFVCNAEPYDGWVGTLVSSVDHLGIQIFGVDFGTKGCFIIGEVGLEKVMDLTKNNTPFGQLDRETQVALFEAWLDGKEIVYKTSTGGTQFAPVPTWYSEVIYKVKPKEDNGKEITKIRKEMEEVTSNLEKLTERLEELEGK